MSDPEKIKEAACAEILAEMIIKNAPYGIMVLDGDLHICRVNMPMCRIVNADDTAALLGKPVSAIFDPAIFAQIISDGKGTEDACVHLPEYDRYIDRIVVYDLSTGKLLCFMRDITPEVLAARKQAELADRVIEKQMRAVQEIASLLGETTAETKIALTKLKESLNDE